MPAQMSSLTLSQHRVSSCCLVFLFFVTQIQLSAGLVVPNEVPSILSLVYSNIPPIKKGTDSRLGFGFRLGEHADFQVLLELGPQKETRPIGNPDDSEGSSFNKRQVNKRQQLRVQTELSSTEKPANTWLDKWSNDAKNSKNNNVKIKKQFANKPAEMPIMPQLPEQTMRQLQMLYKMATSSTTTTPAFASAEESSQAPAKLNASTYLRERLKSFKAPANIEELQILQQKPADNTKTEITKELMDVNLDK